MSTNKIERKVGDTTIVIEVNITVKEEEKAKTDHLFKKGRTSPMKGRHFARTTCELCGKEIAVNAIGKHMRRIHNVSK